MSRKKISFIIAGTLIAVSTSIVLLYVFNKGQPDSVKNDQPFAPKTVLLDTLNIAAGEEKIIIADTITVQKEANILGLLTLQLPTESTTNTVHLRLPGNAYIAGKIIVKNKESTAMNLHKKSLAHFFIPPVVASMNTVPASGAGLVIEAAPPALRISDTSLIETARGAAAPDEVLEQIQPRYQGGMGGSGGDIFIETSGEVVFDIDVQENDGIFTMFNPGNGGAGANVIMNDGTWNDTGLQTASIKAGQGGRSGGLFISARKIRIEKKSGTIAGDPVFLSYSIGDESGHQGGKGGNGGKIIWDVNQPDLTSITHIRLGGGLGGSGLYRGGDGGFVRYAAGKPIVSKDAPYPVTVTVVAGDGGEVAEQFTIAPESAISDNPDYSHEIFFQVPSIMEPKPILLSAQGGNGGTVTVVGHDGWPGTEEHPDGYEPGPVVVRYGHGGNMSDAYTGRGGNGGGSLARVTNIVGGDGGDGFSFCEIGEEKPGGHGGASGHLTVFAGRGGNGSQKGAGGRSGNLGYDDMVLGKPGKGGDGRPPGKAGTIGLPNDSYSSTIGVGSVLRVEDHEGVRLVGMKGGKNGPETNDVLRENIERNANTTFGGSYVAPEQVDGKKCGSAMKVLPLNPNGVYTQSITLTTRTLLPADNQVTTIETVNFTVDMNCPPPNGDYSCFDRMGGTRAVTTQTRDGTKSMSQRINWDGTLLPVSGNAQGISVPDPNRSAMRFIQTPGYYCTNEGQLAFAWSLPGEETATTYYNDGSSDLIYRWSFTGSVAPKEAWPKRFFAQPVCCGANLDPNQFHGRPFQQTYSPFTPNASTRGACVGPIYNE